MRSFFVSTQRTLSALMIGAVFSVSFTALLPERTNAQVQAVYDRGATGLGQKLQRLQTTASALHTAAHPDDEDSGLIAYLARNEHARTAYLSLNRGDGGQNVIGQELFESLGVIRTEELLQARRLDGGGQFFTRFMDYGFSKTRAEAARIWGEQKVLGDMVRTIRLYRPMVVISRFSGTPRDGHGQHQLAGYLTPFAFKAAGDPNAFPEHFQEGLQPWQPLKLYRSQGFSPSPEDNPSLFMNTGTYDPLIGRTYFEVAMEGRSQHKSQEMGTLELRGMQRSGVTLLESSVGDTGTEKSVFDGIDTSIRGIAALAKDNTASLPAKLAELQGIAEQSLKNYNVYSAPALVPTLIKGYRVAKDAAASTSNPVSKSLLEEKAKEFVQAAQLASGVVVDALSTLETVNPGSDTHVTVKVFVPEGISATVKDTKLNVRSGWKAETTEAPAAPETTPFRRREEVSASTAHFKVTVAANEKPTQPYWLESERESFTFDWSNAAENKNQPFAGPLVTANVVVNLGGEDVTITQPVQYRYADDIRGELRRELNVVPAVTLGVESDLLVAPIKGGKTHRVVTTVSNNTQGAIEGTASLDLPSGWRATPQNQKFSLANPGDKTAFTFEVSLPANPTAGSFKITAVANVGGKRYAQSMTEIAYPHMQTHRRFNEAKVTAQVLDMEVSPVKVGYVMGSGDRVPEAIRRMGLDVTMLEEKDLSTGDLSQYDTIVIGIRASQTRPDFVANNGRLFDFARNGGTLVVQYQQHEYVQRNLQPFPASMTGVTRGNQRVSNLRVTDETAKVTILVPSHSVFNFPNKITDADFDNWVQERNLYSFSTFDDRYTALLEAADPDEDPVKGGMLYAPMGKGKYMYVSYSFFRQLPVGVPGAYRLFANILSMPKAEK
ncbi:MAG: PIG-L family deacetylase [Acidobacteria bacterium]|nr:PIG-L family deacetylase [Acidobacteriota bacterium]